jgi:hypothetical protein
MTKVYPKMTAQEVFNKAAKHLLLQNRKSMHEEDGIVRVGNGCAYRSPQGLMCAAGPFIPNEEYRTEMENTTILEIIQDNPHWNLTEHQELLHTLQRVHDNNDPDTWPVILRDKGQERGLDTSIIAISLIKREKQSVPT